MSNMADAKKEEQGIDLTPSANSILDVTPVNSFEEDLHHDPPQEQQEEQQQQEQQEEDGENQSGPEDMQRMARHRLQRTNDDAFSSSSEDDSEEASSPHEGSLSEVETLSSSDEPSQTEWDKAMMAMAGKPSTGKASEFFADARSTSGDSDELFTHSEHEVLREVEGLREGTLIKTPALERAEAATLQQRFPSGSLHASPTSGSVVTTRQSVGSGGAAAAMYGAVPSMRPHPQDSTDNLGAGVLPDVFLNMRQKIEALALFDSDMMKLAADQADYDDDDPMTQESRESLKRSSQQSISAAVLVSLAHKRYERRRLAAMEIEKVVRSLVSQNEFERVRAILLLLSDDYVRSTGEDARKGGVVALAASAIGLKKAPESDATVQECRDLILSAVIHACQDHSQRVRYYATESLFNVVKVMPSLAVQHFFILFEILRSLYADVDADVRSGADLLDKKLKEVIISAINVGSFTADACVPVFARFVHVHNKATKLLTLTWLQELNEKLVGAPIVEFLHLFLGGIYDMVADPTVAIRQSALAFLQSVLPKLLAVDTEEMMAEVEETGVKVDFDKILQSLVTTMEHPDPFVRKVANYWMARIVKAHMVPIDTMEEEGGPEGEDPPSTRERRTTAASVSVRNSVPHVLPGILLSISDSYNPSSAKESFLPEYSTRALAEQTNTYLQDAVRRDGSVYIQHLDAFIFALREELDSPGGIVGKTPPAVERSPYRVDIKQDGTGIETGGWFRASLDTKNRNDDAMVMSRLCALDWVTVLYEEVVPTVLKADYAKEFIYAIIHQMVDNPPMAIVKKSLEVIAKITVPVEGEQVHKRSLSSHSLSGLGSPVWASYDINDVEDAAEFPMTESSVNFALKILDMERRHQKSRDRQVFSALIQLHSFNEHLIVNLSDVLTLMCKLQPPEFVFISFAVELDRFIRGQQKKKSSIQDTKTETGERPTSANLISTDLSFVSSFVQHMSHVLLNAKEAKDLRDSLRDCMCSAPKTEEHRQECRLFHILLHSFAHNMAATVLLCLCSGAYRTAVKVLNRINPLDINLVFLLEIDRVVEMLERPFFRHLHVRMLEHDKDPTSEGSGTMLFQLLKSILMILPQSTCYNVLKDRLTSVSRFRQSTASLQLPTDSQPTLLSNETKLLVDRIESVRFLHCSATWQNIRADSLEVPKLDRETVHDEGVDRRGWLGYNSKEDEMEARRKYKEEKTRRQNSSVSIEEVTTDYDELEVVGEEAEKAKTYIPNEESEEDVKWKKYWADATQR